MILPWWLGGRARPPLRTYLIFDIDVED